MTSFSVVSLIAIVPDSECRMPTLIVSAACAADADSAMAPPTSALVARNNSRRGATYAFPSLSPERAGLVLWTGDGLQCLCQGTTAPKPRARLRKVD